MVTTVTFGLPIITPLSDEDLSIVRRNSLFSSNTLSLFIGTSNGTLICPAGIVTLYGPEL